MGCKVISTFSWADLCKTCLTVTMVDGPSVVSEAFHSIGERLVDLGVSQHRMDQSAGWEAETK